MKRDLSYKLTKPTINFQFSGYCVCRARIDSLINGAI